jgi:hypothetical protein
MASLTLTDTLILRAFNATMSMDKSSTNIRRAKEEVAACAIVGKLIHSDNQKHLYDKRIHKGAGEMKIVNSKAVIEAEGNIRGPVTVNIVNVPVRKRKEAATV